MLSKSAMKRALRARANARLDNHQAAPIVLRSGRGGAPIKSEIPNEVSPLGANMRAPTVGENMRAIFTRDMQRAERANVEELRLPSPNCEREQAKFRAAIARGDAKFRALMGERYA